MSFVKKNNAQLFLFINAILWGSSYVWSKLLLGFLPRFSILFICSLGGLISTGIIFYKSIKKISKDAVLVCILISLFSIISNTFCMLALQYTSSSNTAFIVQLSVVITPIIMAFCEKKVPRPGIIISAFVALAGLFVLTCDHSSFEFKVGDLLALGNALFFSLFIASQNIFAKKLNPVQFTFIHQATNTLVFFIIAALFERQLIDPQALKTPVFGLLISISIFIAVFTILFQSAAIRFVRPEKATLIYTLEPVTALLLASVFIGERIDGIKHLTGCILILSAVVISHKLRFRRSKQYASAYIDPVPEYK